MTCSRDASGRFGWLAIDLVDLSIGLLFRYLSASA
jgi:hypothetical protein